MLESLKEKEVKNEKPYDIVVDSYLLKFGKMYKTVDKNSSNTDFNKSMIELISNKNKLQDVSCDYTIFLSAFRSFMGNSFFVNKKGNKGVAIDSKGVQSISSKKSTMSTIFIGGQTGIKRSNYSVTKVSTEGFIESDRVITLPCFFKLWLPKETDYGILIVQYYGNEKLGPLVMEALDKFLKSYGHKLDSIDKIITNSRKRDFKTKSRISGINIDKKSVSRENAKHLPILEKEESFNVSLKYSGLKNITWNDLKNLFTNKQTFLTIPLTSIGLENGYDVSVTYSYEGKYATGKLSKNFDITPSLIITDNIEFRAKKDEQNYPEYNSLSEYCDSLLLQLQDDMGYTVEELKI